ncbi:MAG TPA: diguanylate cyclase, partial [Methylophilaceae bacterium]|nr:diguanylate cyclase [Methylophilaceae bacterium]
WFTAFLLLGLLGVLFMMDMHYQYEKRSEREREKLATQVNIISANVSAQMSAAGNAMEQLIRGVDFSASARPAVERELMVLLSAMPAIHAMGIMDVDGTLRFSSRSQDIGQNFAQRTYFQAIKSDPRPDRLYVSEPYPTGSGLRVIAIGKAIFGPDKRFQGLVIAGLDADYFKKVMRTVLYAPDMWASITCDNGQIFARAPGNAEAINKSLAYPETMFSQHIASKETHISVLTGYSYTSKTQSMMALKTINPPSLVMDHPLVIAVSRNLEDIYAPWQDELRIKLGLYLMLVVIAICGIRNYQTRRIQYEKMVKETKAALQVSEDNYRVIVENTSELIIKVDPEGFYTYVNPAFCALYNATAEQLIGRHYSQDVFQEDLPLVKEFLEKLMQPPYEVNFVHRENTVYGVRFLEWRGRAIRDEAGKLKELVGVARDVTERMESMGRLQQQAQTDYLTSLANRRHFMEQGQIELERAKRYNKPLSIFMIDIDYFKKINDTYGHKFGDYVLQTLAGTLRETLRLIDLIGRIGGEEFAVLLPETGLREAAEVAERLRDRVARTNVPREEGMPINFTISIGVCALKDKDTTLDVLLSQADAAMYEAKQSGRNKVTTAT